MKDETKIPIVLLKCLLIIINIALLFSLSGCGRDMPEINVAEKIYSLNQLQEDFSQLRKEVKTKHPNLYLSDNDLNLIFDKQYSQLKDGMTEHEFYHIVSPAISALGCGHTNIYISKDYEKYLKDYGKYLPLLVKLVDDRLFVYENLSSADIPVGSEILSINGKVISEITGILLDNLTADGYNQTKKYYILNHWFNAVYYYFVENPDEFAIEYSKPDQDMAFKVVVPSIKNSKMFMTTMSIYFEPTEGDVYYGEVHEDYARLLIKSFRSSKVKMSDYKKYLKSFFAELKEKDIPNLIIDLRGNWGGTPNPAAHLFSYLISEPAPYFEKAMFIYFSLKKPVKPAENNFTGSIYILTDGASFSTTGHLCSLLKYHNVGTFIGEESGGGAVVTDGGKNITLRNTKLRIYCATKVFTAAVSRLPEGHGVIPDYEIRFSLQDYLKGNDPQLQKAIELINKGI